MGYKVLEKQAERFAARLSEVVDELGAYSNILKGQQDKIDTEDVAPDKLPSNFTTVILSGYYCYYLSREAHSLIMILREFLPILEDSYKQSDARENEEKLAVMKKAVMDIDPLITRTMEDMSPFKVMDLNKIVDALRNRGRE